MGLAFWLYITDFISNIDVCCGMVWIIYLLVLGMFSFTWGASESNETIKLMSNLIKKTLKLWWIPILALAFSIFIPNKRTVYLMLGASYLSQSNLPSKVSQILDLKLDNIIGELNKDNVKIIKVQVKDDK